MVVVFVRKPEQKRNLKWDAKADVGILLGYEDVGYRVLINGKIIVARNVEFIERGVKYISLDDTVVTEKSSKIKETKENNLEIVEPI